MKFALLQDNPTVGALQANAALLRQARKQAKDVACVVASELFLTGYPPEDLVLKRAFVSHCREIAEAVARDTADGGPAVIFGLPWVENGQLYNSVMLADGGQYAVRHKVHLPNYAVFDEKRLFTSGSMPDPVELRGMRIGLPICEDLWFSDVALHLKSHGAELLISPNGSPYETNKHAQRLTHVRKRCLETRLPLVYVNQLGGQDELVFDGSSFVMNAAGQIVHQLPRWQNDLSVFDASSALGEGRDDPAADSHADMYQAAMLGLRDYVEKNHFPGVLLGLSGGVDSALCAALAVDAIGADRVRCFMLPSRFTSAASLDDATACAKALGVQLDTIAISPMVEAGEGSLAPLFAGRARDITEENIQSRIRGTLLMALSNKLGHMLVTTGNKSEVSVGYATLYGDMNGGYNPIKDIYKTDVFALCRWRNRSKPLGGKGPEGLVIPVSIIEKPPSAELREDQKDEDSLPPYDILDGILMALVEDECGFDDMVARGFAPETVKQIEHLLYVSEYKRRQSAPGPKIGRRNFGRDRRYPITNGFRDGRFKG
jgi:NAD+ synthase